MNENLRGKSLKYKGRDEGKVAEKKKRVEQILNKIEAKVNEDDPSDENTDDEEIRNQAKFKKHAKGVKTVE